MKVKTAYSSSKDTISIITDLKEQIGSFNSRLILFFASPAINPGLISGEIQKAFPKSQTMGCSSSGEIISGKMLDKSIVLMAFGPEIVDDCKIEVLTNISSDNNQVDDAMDSFGHYYNHDVANLDPEDYVGMVLIDGLSGKEEKINERIGDLTNITFIGGSAGDDLQFEKTYLYANGKTYTNAAVLVLIKSNTNFDILKTQSFNITDKKAAITKVDEANRKVIEINHKPATKAYADLVGVSNEEVGNSFFSHPLGLVFGDDVFVRSPQKTVDDNIVFFCSIKEGMELNLLDSDDIIGSTKKDLDDKIREFGNISAIINFNCILRTIELKEKKQEKAYADIFSDIPTIGFSTYGESYIGHINQTATLLLFK